LLTNEERLKAEVEQLRDAAADNDVLQENMTEAHSRIEQLVIENESLKQKLNDLHTSAYVDELHETELESVFSAAASGERQHHEDDHVPDVPVFNLAEQIMEEHRRSIAGRRQRVKATTAAKRPHSIKDVIGHFIPSSSDRYMPSEQLQTATNHYLWTDQSLTPFQREILREIVRKDMELGADNKLTMTNYSSMHN